MCGTLSSANRMRQLLKVGYKVVCPNLGHPALNSSFTKYEICRQKIVLPQL